MLSKIDSCSGVNVQRRLKNSIIPCLLFGRLGRKAVINPRSMSTPLRAGSACGARHGQASPRIKDSPGQASRHPEGRIRRLLSSITTARRSRFGIKDANQAASTPAPGSNDALVDDLRSKMGVEALWADLILTTVFDAPFRFRPEADGLAGHSAQHLHIVRPLALGGPR
jgi:hypothetical protein